MAPRASIRLAEMPSKERVAFWSDFVCRNLLVAACDVGQRDGFDGRLDLLAIGEVKVATAYSSELQLKRTGSDLARAQDDQMVLMLQQSGSMHIEQSGQTVVLQPGNAAWYDSTLPSNLHFHGAFQQTILLLPRDLLARTSPALSKVSGPGSLTDATAVRMLGGVAQGLMAADDASLQRGGTHWQDALTQLVVAATGAGENRRAGDLRTYHQLRVREFVRANLAEPQLDVAAIARAVHLSPAHLHRLFSGEETLMQMVWRERLEASRRALSQCRGPLPAISQVAYRFGFQDAAHFSRRFKERYGQTPSEFARQTCTRAQGAMALHERTSLPAQEAAQQESPSAATDRGR